MFRQDVHSRYRTAAHDDVVARFNERFILSLGSCDDCLVLDDELNVLPISKGKDIVPLEDDKGKSTKSEGELKGLKAGLSDTKPVGDLIQLAKTVDQVRYSIHPPASSNTELAFRRKRFSHSLTQ